MCENNMQKRTIDPQILAETKGKELDLARNYSFAPTTDTRNFIDEHVKAFPLAYTITNKTAQRQTIVMIANLDGLTLMPNVKSLVPGAVEFKEGIVIDGAEAGKDLIITSQDSQRSIEHLLQYAFLNPTRITRFSMNSRTIAGERESGNYSTKMTTVFVSPFTTQPAKELPLRPLVAGGMNFNTDMLDVDFIKQRFPVILSSEHLFTFQINPNTEIDLTMFVGVQDSGAQRFWRDVKAADAVVAPMLIS